MADSVENMAFDLMNQAEKEGDLFATSNVSSSNEDVLNMIFEKIDSGNIANTSFDDVVGITNQIQSKIPKSTDTKSLLNNFVDKVRKDPYLSDKYGSIMGSLVEDPETGLIDYAQNKWKGGI